MVLFVFYSHRVICGTLQATFVYWITSNFFSLGQVALLKIPVVRKGLGIPDVVVHTTATGQSGSFWENMKAGKIIMFLWVVLFVEIGAESVTIKLNSPFPSACTSYGSSGEKVFKYHEKLA